MFRPHLLITNSSFCAGIVDQPNPHSKEFYPQTIQAILKFPPYDSPRAQKVDWPGHPPSAYTFAAIRILTGAMYNKQDYAIST
jgi:hypothetical protein